MKQEIYVVEVGDLVSKDSAENYLRTLKNGEVLYVVDDNIALFIDKDKAIKWGNDYVKQNGIGTYALIGIQLLDLDYVTDDDIQEIKDFGIVDSVDFETDKLDTLIELEHEQITRLKRELKDNDDTWNETEDVIEFNYGNAEWSVNKETLLATMVVEDDLEDLIDTIFGKEEEE